MISTTVIMGVLRHILTIVGGYLAAKFALDPSILDGAIAAVVSLVGIVWSITSKQPFEPLTEASVSPTVTDAAPVVAAPVSLLGDPMAAVVKIKSRAPYGYRKNGVPKKKPGKKTSSK